MAEQKTLEVLAIDFFEAFPIFRSVASAYEISHCMQNVWKPIDLIVDVRGAVTGNSQIGVWEAKVPNSQQLTKSIDDRTDAIVKKFVEVCFKDPVTLKQHLDTLVSIRDRCLENIHSRMNEFNSINNWTLGTFNFSVFSLKLGRFVNNIAMISATLAATIYGAGLATAEIAGVKVTAATATGGGVGVAGVPILKNLSVSVAKNWEESKNAKAVQVAFEAKKSVASVAGDNANQLEKCFGLEKSNAEVASAKKAKQQLSKLVEEKKAVAQSEKAKLNRMEKQRVGGQSKKGKAARQARIEKQRGLSKKADFEYRNAKAGSNNAKTQYRKAKISHNTSVKYNNWATGMGKVIKVGATTVFTAWDLYDAFAELGE